MAKAYLVAVYYKIHDEEKLKNYGADALPAMMANGGTALARGTNISEIEGVPPERAVVVEFESVEAAQKAYTTVKPIRLRRKNSKEVWTACYL